MLPTSFLFKNRLFIERDSKHRRIYNMFGSLFRNSKWANYEFSNLKLELKSRFKFFVYRCIIWFGLFLILYVNKYFSFNEFIGMFCTYFWMFLDTINYCINFFVWSILFLFYKILYWIYIYFLEHFFNVSTAKRPLTHKEFLAFYKIQNSVKLNNQIISTYELPTYFFHWLQNKIKIKEDSDLKIIFSSKCFPRVKNDCIAIFKKLYESAYYCITSNKKQNLLTQSVTPEFLLKPTNPILIENLLNVFANFNQKYIFKNNFNQQIWDFLNSQYNYNNSPYLTRIPAINFYLNSPTFLSFSHSMTENSFFSYLEKCSRSQVNAAKWNRWLFRYSIIHRRLLKNTHKITSTKKMLQTGIYDHLLTATNPWINHRLIKFNKILLNHSNTLFYANFFSSSKKLNFNSHKHEFYSTLHQETKLSFFTFYENSFFWFVKRFYFFNTLSTNFILSHPSQNFTQNINFLSAKKIVTHFSLLDAVSKSYLISTFDWNLANIPNFNYTKFFSFESKYFNKDLHLIFQENDFLNLEILDIMYWINSSIEINNTVSAFYFDFFINKKINSLLPYFNLSSQSITQIHNQLNFVFLIDYSFFSDVFYFQSFFK